MHYLAELDGLVAEHQSAVLGEEIDDLDCQTLSNVTGFVEVSRNVLICKTRQISNGRCVLFRVRFTRRINGLSNCIFIQREKGREKSY